MVRVRNLGALAGAVVILNLAADVQACGPRGYNRGAAMHTSTVGSSASALPAPRSEGAALVGAYCTQCHGAPNPALHAAQEWRTVVERMYRRMQQFSSRVYAPSDDEFATIVAYLEDYAPGGTKVP